MERVAAANAEAIAALPPGGTAVVPAGVRELDPYLDRDDLEIRRFGPEEVELDDGHGTFHLDGHAIELELPFTQRHQAVNTLAALHAYAALGLPLERVGDGVPDIALSPWRGEELPLPGRRVRHQRRVQREPGLHARRARASRRARRRGAGRSRSWARWRSWAKRQAAFHLHIGALCEGARSRGRRRGRGRARIRPRRLGPDAEHAVEAARTAVEPGDAVLVKASRAVGLEGIAERDSELRRGMVPVLIAGLLAMVAAIVIGPKFIERLRARDLGQQIRAEGPASHAVKQGTPTMGGVLIVGSAVIPFLVLSQYTTEALTVLFITLGCAAIGFADDYLKLRRQALARACRGRWKMVSPRRDHGRAALLLRETAGFDTSLYIPVAGWTSISASSTTRSSSSSSPAR